MNEKKIEVSDVFTEKSTEEMLTELDALIKEFIEKSVTSLCGLGSLEATKKAPKELMDGILKWYAQSMFSMVDAAMATGAAIGAKGKDVGELINAISKKNSNNDSGGLIN